MLFKYHGPHGLHSRLEKEKERRELSMVLL